MLRVRLPQPKRAEPISIRPSLTLNNRYFESCEKIVKAIEDATAC
jgi:hypothetical protein